MYVYVCVSVRACVVAYDGSVYECVLSCMCAWIVFLFMRVCMCVYVSVPDCACVWYFLCTSVCVYGLCVCVSVCTSVGMCACFCMYVCMCVWRVCMSPCA